MCTCGLNHEETVSPAKDEVRVGGGSQGLVLGFSVESGAIIRVEGLALGFRVQGSGFMV